MRLKKTFYKNITSYNPRKITPPRSSKYEQDAWNCRLYAWLNWLYFNTRIETDVDDYKLYLKNKRISTQWANVAYTSVFTLGMYWSDKNICGYGFSILENTKLFAQLLASWYSLIYSRTNNSELLLDIHKDDEVDVVRPKKWTNNWWHVATIRFENWKLKEYWTRWDSVFNEFTYDSIDLFIKAVKAWVIDDKVFFLDYFQ